MASKILRRAILVTLLVAGALALMATATWVRPQTLSAYAQCTVGNEGIAGPTNFFEGLDVSEVASLNLYLELDSGNLPSGVYLRAWVQNPNARGDGGTGAGTWTPVPGLDLGPTKGGKNSEGWPNVLVVNGTSRVAYLPDTCGSACRVYMNGSRNR